MRFVLLVLFSVISGYYIEEKYKERVVDVAYKEIENNRASVSFVLNGIEYQTIIYPDFQQQFGKSAYTTYKAIYTRKRIHTKQSPSFLPAPFSEVTGWFIQERGTKNISGVIFNDGEIIHIKPKSLLYPDDAFEETCSMVAFKADAEYPEYVCDAPLDTVDQKEIDGEESEEEYLDQTERYFEVFGRKKNDQEDSFYRKLIDSFPPFLKNSFFSWFPQDTHKTKLYSVSQQSPEDPMDYDSTIENTPLITNMSKKRSRMVINQIRKGCGSCKGSQNKIDTQNAEEKRNSHEVDNLVDDTVYHSLINSSLPITQAINSLEEHPLHFPKAKNILVSPNSFKTNHTKIQAPEIEEKFNGSNEKFLRSKEYPKKEKKPKKGEKIFFGVPFYAKLSQIEQVIRKRENYGFPIEKRGIPIAAAMDREFIKKNGSVKKAILYVLETISIASSIYERTFNVALYVSDFIIDKNAEWYYSATDLLAKLEQFTEYRKGKRKSCMIYHLFCGDTISNKKLGLAWTGYIGYNAKKNVSTSILIQNQFITVAHEIGHNIGLIHDCDNELCKEATPTTYPCHPCKGCDCQGKYIMNRKGASNLLSFSMSSQREISVIFSQLDSELLKVNEIDMPYPICGNGIMGYGKECDAGPFGDACCTPDCKLRPEAQCSDVNSKCCQNCQISSKGTICHNPTNECQTTSLCDGESASCSPLIFKPNRSSCSLGFCADGICTNRDIQCTLAGDRNRIISSYSSHKGCAMKCLNIRGEVVHLSTKYFKNGTPCGWDGVCLEGRCEKDLRIAAMSIFIFLCGIALFVIYMW
ncbi:hypothetical protein NEFER03_0608 [Nematocida sp. LUAm3]|nr:hypothetical protein NEFER03_0608 [Nematocida sp. LUAm3]KAI5175575.1 hypothetical protein NEFER02_1481 [Nematocida sp. LUAm2]KAI5178395.1 hypothetical protein NEFER01_1542 [Nematocida sp. LUAm1]